MSVHALEKLETKIAMHTGRMQARCVSAAQRLPRGIAAKQRTLQVVMMLDTAHACTIAITSYSKQIYSASVAPIAEDAQSASIATASACGLRGTKVWQKIKQILIIHLMQSAWSTGAVSRLATSLASRAATRPRCNSQHRSDGQIQLQLMIMI